MSFRLAVIERLLINLKLTHKPNMLLVASIVLAFLPAFIIWLHINWWTMSTAALVALTWLVVAIGYCRTMRRKSALWVFVLLLVAFGPFIFFR